MATQFVSTDISGPGTRVNLADGNGVWVSRNGLVGSTDDSIAIYGSGNNHMVHIEGAVSGGTGVRLGNSSTLDSGNAVVIASTGVVYGSNFGVAMNTAAARLDNFGLIDGTVFLAGEGPGMSRIDNAGDIIDNSIAVYHLGSEALSLNNSGTIRGTVAAFQSGGDNNRSDPQPGRDDRRYPAGRRR